MRDESASTMRIDIHPDFKADTILGGPESQEEAGAASDSSWSGRRSGDFKHLLQGIYDAVLITDLDGRILDFNARALDFLLAHTHTLEGTNVVEHISGADESLLQAIHRNLEAHRYTLVEAHCVRSNNNMFPAEIAVNRVMLDGKPHLCFLVRDITRRRREEAALEEAIARLEDHDRAKSQFVTNVSHELRTPLTSMIYGLTNIMKGVAGPVSEKLRRYLEILDADCKRLLGTVNDILDLRKIENKAMPLARTPVPLWRLVRRSVESLRLQAEQKTINLNASPRDANLFVECDIQKMERVIINVIGNSIKFTSDRGVIDVNVTADPERDGWVRFTVTDNGVGIPAEALPRVTERYFTVGEQASGCGLGLALAKEIIDLHGGTIEIASPPPGRKRGTQVRVGLPAAEAPVILLADDDPEVRSVMQKQIEGVGYRTESASTASEALEKIASSRPDMVVLDLLMPDMDGTEVILKMRSEKDLARIPVLVVTGVNIGRAKAEILSGFAIPAMSKPWTQEQLLDHIEGVFVGVAAVRR